jgi:branched-chain amino acid transport system ATP-binding protein
MSVPPISVIPTFISGSPMLEIEGLKVRFGEVQVLAGVDLRVEQGEIVCLIGANGAGKTTLLKAVSALVRPAAGRIDLDKTSLVGLPPDAVVARGVAHVPEGRRIFPQLTVDENLRVGAHLLRDTKRMRARLDRVYRLFPRLQERKRQSGQTLSGGEQQMLALGRAMMSEPRLLLLDEPSLGLAPLVIVEVARTIPIFRQEGVSVLVVEQNANLALALSQRGYVLERGHIVLSDTAENLRNNRKIIESYLGGTVADETVKSRMSGRAELATVWPTTGPQKRAQQ